jgi:hypothetical protein
MFKCNWVRKRLSEYLDGELVQYDRVRVHEHLRDCQPCSDELESLSNAISLIVAYDSERMPAAIKTFHLPRSTFIDLFPSIRDEKWKITSGILVPYLSAAVLFFMVITAAVTIQETFFSQYNASNYVEVFGN